MSSEHEVVTDIVSGSLDVLELNLLYVTWAFRFEPLRLNKSGAPNRRSLLRTARGIVFPGSRREIGESVDLSDPEQIDYLAFVLAISIELGTLVTSESGGELRVDPEAQGAFFDSTVAVRTRRIHDALAGLRFWNELRSHAFWQTEQRDEEHLSLLEPTGKRLIGARGAVFSVLKKMAPETWTLVEDLAEHCRDHHDDYLEHALADDVATQGFVHAVVRRALSWSGLADLGKMEGESTFQLTERGRIAFGVGPFGDTTPTPDKGVVVQPNLEITVMLDATPISTLHRLHRVARRVALADRVATFALSAETVQRGYAAGATSESLLEMLNEGGVTPVPDSVKFQLMDWERMHRRVSIYADGMLFRHSDPDHLDLVVGQLKHDNPDVEVVRLGPSTTFFASTELEGLRRVFDREGAIDVDYLGTQPPCLKFAEPLVVTSNPITCDVVTDWYLEQIAEVLPGGSRTEKSWRLDPHRIEQSWPDDPFDRVIEFLEPRAIGGLPAVQYLKLRSQLAEPTRASIRHDVTVLTIDNAENARRLATAPEVEAFIIGRLGDRTFAIEPETEQELLDVLHDIGIRGGALDE